ncbi:MAG: hypothetical protein CML46_20035 [Rhodobacteraceae bacterium]|nr:hypothetical protein [Paracoccaceae bacterium]MBR29201.1 hypothetical protein [Paracoccaceae bacterium]
MLVATKRFLRGLEDTAEVSVPIEGDDEGYLDRECPSDECLFEFKVHGEDWAEKVRDEEVFCPLCGHAADSDQWWTHRQIEHAQAAAVAQLEAQLGAALRMDAQRFNRRQPRGTFVSMAMEVDTRHGPVALPPAAAEPMKLKITCTECACRYAVIGAGYFCPACGHSAAEHVFEQTMNGIRASMDAVGRIKAAIFDRDVAEATAMLVAESGLQAAITAFQRAGEALFQRLPLAPKARRNAFQNISEGSALWQQATGRRYEDHIDVDALQRLQVAFQQRHLLAHRQGLVDEEYVSKSRDTRYRVGQRIVVRPEWVRETTDIIENLVLGLRADIPASAGSQPSD